AADAAVDNGISGADYDTADQRFVDGDADIDPSVQAPGKGLGKLLALVVVQLGGGDQFHIHCLFLLRLQQPVLLGNIGQQGEAAVLRQQGHQVPGLVVQFVATEIGDGGGLLASGQFRAVEQLANSPLAHHGTQQIKA